MSRERVMAGVLLILAAGAAGALAEPFAFDASRVPPYLAAHPEREAAVGADLSAGRPAAGMTAQEIRLCLGRPSRVEKRAEGGFIWHFSRPAGASRGISYSDLYQTDVPVARVAFGLDGVAIDVLVYGAPREEESEVPAAAPRPAPPPVAPPAVPAPAPAAAGPEPAPPGEPAPRAAAAPESPVPEASALAANVPDAGFEGWPALAVGGVLVERSARAVLVNGVVKKAGEDVVGVTILAVEPAGAIVAYGGQVRLLRVGASTSPQP